jgi:hypothetical protein
MNKILTIKAQRIASTDVGDGRYVITAFLPDKATIKAFTQELVDTEAEIELDDETGWWGNHLLFTVDDITLSEDDRVLVLQVHQ